MRKSAAFCALLLGGIILSACARTPVATVEETVAIHEHHRGNDAHHGKNGSGHNHDEHNHHGGEAHNHALHHCEVMIPRDKADIPDFSKTNWKKIETITQKRETDIGEKFFVYIFYKDTNRPEVPVAAATSVIEPGPSFTNVMWDTGEKKRRTVLKSRDPVCESSLYGTDGKRYDLEGFMEKIRAWANKN